MQGHNLQIPPEIELLMKKGIWPDSYEKGLKQNSLPIFPIENLKHIIPEEETIYFRRPPFQTVRQELESDTSNYWSEFGAVSELNPDLSVIIGDFGIGSDAPLILKYESQKSTPSVWKLVWAKKGNYWREVSPSFEEFMEALGLNVYLPTYTKPIRFGGSQQPESSTNFFCHCCGFNSLSEEPNGTYEICQICFWEDDPIQSNDPNYKGGANSESLIEARKNFTKFGACRKSMIKNVRKPDKNDIRNPNYKVE